MSPASRGFVTACVAGLEVWIFGGEGPPERPVVFVAHGRNGTAATVFDLCRDLAADGLVAVTLDQRNHGRRLVDPEANNGWGLGVPADMYGIALGTAADVSTLIDFLPARLGVGTGRLGMTGVSLGGHATLLAMSLDARIFAGAPMIGSGDYRRLMELRAEANHVRPERFPEFFPPALEAAVERHDPVRHPERFADRPLLLLNGAEDRLVQAECGARLEAALRPHYTRPERLALRRFPGVAHATPPAMWQEARTWLRHWLLETE